MEIAILGLGRMGKGIALKLKEKGHDVLAWNRSAEPREEVKAKGCRVIDDHRQVAAHLKAPRVVWLMLPAGDVTEEVLQDMLATLSPGDILIDGGNSYYKDTLRRHAMVEAKGLYYLDVGVSGGTLAAKIGYCCMVGGEKIAFTIVEPIFRDLTIAGGYLHCGMSGTGHYVKMVHNAIEYAEMQAIGEGFELLKGGSFPHLDLHAIAKLWNHGSIVRGYLMECTEQALEKDPALSTIADYIEDNGEGKWTVQEALDRGVPFLATTYALFSRYLSRQPESFAYKVVAAQRNEFGGHKVKEK